MNNEIIKTYITAYAALVATYAAIVSSISLIWNIREAIKKNQGRLKVNTSYYVTSSFNALDEHIGYSNSSLRVSVVNTGLTKRIIRQPCFEFNRKILGIKDYVNFSVEEEVKFPLELNIGEEYIRNIDLTDFYRQFGSSSKNRDKFKIVICDTLGKKYKSSSIKIKDLKKQIINTTKAAL